jgi:ABC-type glycerol-3-phosphate transport system permease component
MEKLIFPYWIVTIVAVYGAAALWLTVFLHAARRRRVDLAGGLVVVLLATVLVFRWTPLPHPARLWVLSGPVLAAGVAYWLFVVRREPEWKHRKRVREDGGAVVAHLALLTASVVFMLPFVWLVMTSLKADDQIFSQPASLPSPVMWANYPEALEFLEKALPVGTHHGLVFVGNTLWVSALSLIGVLLSCSMVGYSFARLRWPGRDTLFVVLLATMMLPAAVTMIPTFLIFRWLGWIDSLKPLWFPGFFAPAFYVFLLRQFFLTIPRELEDAAKIDGCSYWRIYWSIMLPQIKPALAAVAIMHFLVVWNDFMGPLIYISSPEKMTGSYALQLFQSAHSGEWAMLMAAATLWTIPVLALFFLTQRYFIQGVTLTGLKG